jgi:hypothetical protein
MFIAKTVLIQQMTKFQWPNKAITALAKFLTHIEVHPDHQRKFGEQALLTYQAHVWQSWHNALKQNTAFNTALFNEDLLQSIYKEVVDKAQLQSLNEISFSFSFVVFSYTHETSPPQQQLLPVLLLMLFPLCPPLPNILFLVSTLKSFPAMQFKTI